MSPYDVLFLHTMGSADMTGVKDRQGSLEPGKFADLAAFDPARLGMVTDPYASLVLVTAERDIERVYVGGVLKVIRGRVVGEDMGKIQAEADRRSKAAVKH